MDIEGAELFALQGMKHLLSRDKPTILMEVNRPLAERAGYALKQVWDFLDQFGYRAWVIRQASINCSEVLMLDDIELVNMVFHIGDLPSDVTSGWDIKSVLHWALTEDVLRSGDISY